MALARTVGMAPVNALALTSRRSRRSTAQREGKSPLSALCATSMTRRRSSSTIDCGSAPVSLLWLTSNSSSLMD